MNTNLLRSYNARAFTMDEGLPTERLVIAGGKRNDGKTDQVAFYNGTGL